MHYNAMYRLILCYKTANNDYQALKKLVCKGDV